MDRTTASTNDHSSKPKVAIGGSVLSPSRTAAPVLSSSPHFPPIQKAKKVSPKKLARGGLHKVRKVSLPKVSSVTFATGNGAQEVDSGEELEVLKCVLVREGYLQRLGRASAAGQISGSHLSETVDLLDLIRLATLETVEAIVTWRNFKLKVKTDAGQRPKPVDDPEPFKWNGINYLLKLASDLEFLTKHSGLTQWLGFSLQRNPFILPLNLDYRAKLSLEQRQLHRPENKPASADYSQFVQVGGKRTQVSTRDGQHSPANTEEFTNSAEALAQTLAERKRAKTPYETRVVNDEELIPATSSKVGAIRPKTRAPARAGKTNCSSVLPSQIGDVDMARIQEAEIVVLHEEAVFGRYSRDVHGRVVPEDEAERRFGMVELSGNAYNVSASLPSSYTTEALESDALRMVDPSHSDIPGKLHAKKRSAMLGPISKPNWRSFERPPPPRRRSRGAQLEQVLAAEREVNVQLGVLIDGLREETERKAMDVAYFESCSELQVYKDELRTFTAQALHDLAVLRRELQEKQYTYESKIVNIQKKEELFNTFKMQHKTAKDVNLVKRIEAHKELATKVPSLNQDQQCREDQEQTAIRVAAAAEYREHEKAAPFVQQFCAIQIQRIARGMLARELFAQMKIEFVVASICIQAGVRGFLVRRRVAKLYWQTTASVHLQRAARGFLARCFVRSKRRRQLRDRSAEQIQKVVRGRIGRVRMAKIRELVHWRLDLALTARSITAVALQELAEVCQSMIALPKLLRATTNPEDGEKPLPVLVLGIVRLLMVFTSDADDEWDIPNTRWREAAHFLNCSVSLARRIQNIADIIAGAARASTTRVGGFAAAGVALSTPYLRESALGLALFDAHRSDLDFNAETFERLPRGWQAATAIFRWVTAFSRIARLQHLIDPVAAQDDPFLVVHRTLTKREAQHEITERREGNHHEETVGQRFVPAELVQARGYPHHRPRPVLLVVANDVPRKARNSILGKLQEALPGLFLMVTRPPPSSRKTCRADELTQVFNFKLIRETLALGHGVILEGDIGMRDATQRAFLSCFATVKNGLHPLPMCVLLRGTLNNRSDLFDPKEGSELEEEKYRDEVRRRMVDADVRLALDHTTRLRLGLAEDTIAEQMIEQSQCEVGGAAPAPGLVIVMEAVIVLITPNKIYEGPSHSESGFVTTAVSWRLSRRLLAKPAFLRAKLQQVNITAIPLRNLTALERYLKHPLWPNAVVARSQFSSSRLLLALSDWVESAIGTARLIAMDGTGSLAPEITRAGPVAGLFERVVVFSNSLADYVEEGDGEDTALMQLLDAVLADVQVYRTAHSLGNSGGIPRNKKGAGREGERCVVTLFHECRRIFATAYSPSTGQRWITVLSEDDIDGLLAPTAMPLGGEVRANKLPPQSHAEMYSRLARLCLLQKRRLDELTDDRNVLTQQEFVVRPRAIRLYRHTLQLGGFLVTVTIAELARGHAQIDAFVHGSSNHLSIKAISLTTAVKLESILGRMSAARARRCFMPAPRIPALLLDRLHLFRVARTETVAPESLDKTVSLLRLSVKTTENAPGRVLLRRAVRVPGPNSFGASCERWVFTLTERHEDGEFCAAFYIPRTSSYRSICLSTSAAQELVRLSKHTTPSQLQKVLLQGFRFAKSEAKPQTGDDDSTAEEEEPEENSLSCYRPRRRIVSRFPLVLRVVQNPHQHLTKRQVVRVYIQAELCDEEPNEEQDGSSVKHQLSIDALRYRVWMPESCSEQTLVLQQSEIESSLPDKLSWKHAFRAEQKIMARYIAHRYFSWEPNDTEDSREHGCVIAHLSCGSFRSVVVAPQLGGGVKDERRTQTSYGSDVDTKKPEQQLSMSAQDKAPVLVSSCVCLLDERETESDDEENGDVENSKESARISRRRRHVYSYDTEEVVHHGSYRVNGLQVVVRVTMRAELRNDLRPTLSSPTDRVRERDSFLIQFQVYHPASSSSAIATVRGEHELREVVGPDKPFLISSGKVDDLIRHIIRTRIDVQLDDGDDKSKPTLGVEFLRDRLYAKQKATPATKTFARDSEVNAAKLIDETRRRGAAGERGVKILTAAKVLPGCGRVLLTVFDVAASHRDKVGEKSVLLLRVDAYVCSTSSRLSLLLETSDLVHVVGQEDKELLAPSTIRDADSEGNDKMEEQRSRKLAMLVLEYLRVERRNDGRGGRLVLSDCCYLPLETRKSGLKSTRIFKMVRVVERSPVLLSAYLEENESETSLRLEVYDPADSSHCELRLTQTQLSGILGLPASDICQCLTGDGLVGPSGLQPLEHICSFLHIEKVPATSDGVIDNPATYSMTLLVDNQGAEIDSTNNN